MIKDIPYSGACERNKGVILEILRQAFRDMNNVLEVGSGTGQHAVHFALNMPHLEWQLTDLDKNIHGLNLRLEKEGPPNVLNPLVLDVSEVSWPVGVYGGIFTANTFHIMSEVLVEQFFRGLCPHLERGGVLCVYGPFNYGCEYTSESNKRFDEFLRARDPESGIKDFEWVCSLAEVSGLRLVNDHEMPANNRLLEWRKII